MMWGQGEVEQIREEKGVRSHEEKLEESQDSQAIKENIKSHRSYQSRAIKAEKATGKSSIGSHRKAK